MCGIAGFWDTRLQASQETLLDLVQQMGNTLAHRGPDSSGTWADATQGIAFAHSRLAILDLSPAGHQPMVSQNGKCVLTYNGEVYNFAELRSELEDGGCTFRGHSDTEVLVEAFSRWGVTPTLRRCHGMFAFAAWMTEEQRLVLGRDRMGQKPLYFGWQGPLFFFASELRALKQHPEFRGEIDPSVVAAYFRYSCLPAPFSIYKQISKLGPAEVATVTGRHLGARRPVEPTHSSPHQPVDVETYWSLADVARSGESKPLSLSAAEATELLDQKIQTAVKRRLVADVPVGAFLSGGIDSSVVVACMQKVAQGRSVTFTIGYEDEKFNEAPFAKAVAEHLGTEHHELYVSADDALQLIPDVAKTYDEPFADISQIPTMLVSRLARQHVTVALSGDGGDELFCGYDRYFSAQQRWEKLKRTPALLRNVAYQFCVFGERILSGNDWLKRTQAVLASRDAIDLFASRRERIHNSLTLVPAAQPLYDVYTDPTQRARLSEPLNEMMYLDQRGWLLDDILVKVDRASMGTSLEVRNPLLDHDLIEFAWQVPLSMKLRDRHRKWLLREVLLQDVPRELIDRPKRGFAVPIGDWLRGPLKDWAEHLLDEQRISQQGLLSPRVVRTYWQQFLAGSNRYRMIVWSLLMFQAWLEEQE